jgi:hypothetical protein
MQFPLPPFENQLNLGRNWNSKNILPPKKSREMKLNLKSDVQSSLFFPAPTPDRGDKKCEAFKQKLKLEKFAIVASSIT